MEKRCGRLRLVQNYMKSTEIFVANGLVWSRDLKGRDPKTGKVVRTLVQEMTGPMSHDRCYRNRITHRYYLNSATGGTDFLGLDGSLESPNPWARSTCGLAVMPANGMIYSGPYVCQCAIGTMASGRERVVQRLREYREAIHRGARTAFGERTCLWKSGRCRRHGDRLADLSLFQHA